MCNIRKQKELKQANTAVWGESDAKCLFFLVPSPAQRAWHQEKIPLTVSFTEAV